MHSRLALLCPGQGAQGPAMFDFARLDPAAGAALYAWLAGAGLDLPVEAILADEGLLFANRYAQPLMVAATLANWMALGPDLPAPNIVAGYSIGELSAYGVAGALRPEDAVTLAAQRARLMDGCLAATPRQALIALSGLPIRVAAEMARAFGFAVAIETGEDSLIAGGEHDTHTALAQAIEAAGGRASLLPVTVASHTPFMAKAVGPFAALLRQQPLGEPAVPVVSGITAEPIGVAERAVEHLSRQLAEPIRWKDGMDALVEAGVTVALELGPGAALTRMLSARHPQIACRSIADFRSPAGVRAWLSRHVE
ncbi:ACP S-malonyltransferase [Massilia suwonensis]|uniref:ACP S-malonyltransferase n=1 Tax=Massilia suwonensis TaxID=648895 RepID=A0ABW0MVB4_9BURK